MGTTFIVVPIYDDYIKKDIYQQILINISLKK